MAPAGSGGAAPGGGRPAEAWGQLCWWAWPPLQPGLSWLSSLGGSQADLLLLAGSLFLAACWWPAAVRTPLPLGAGSTGGCCSAPGRTPPTPTLPPKAGVLEKPRLPGQQWRGRLPLPAGHRAAQGAPDCSWPPAPGPFFPLFFVQDLLIWEQGPFMWHWASPGLPVPPMAGDFLFIWS